MVESVFGGTTPRKKLTQAFRHVPPTVHLAPGEIERMVKRPAGESIDSRCKETRGAFPILPIGPDHPREGG